MAVDNLYIMDTGHLRSDGGCLYGTVPKLMWEKLETPDDNNRLLTALRCLLIIEGDKRILIDTGVGNYHNAKMQNRYALDQPHFCFNQALAKYDLSTADITDVILTHLHYDHSGGIVPNSSDPSACVFPNATIHIQKAHWQWANNPSLKDKAGFINAHLQTIKHHGKLNLIDGPVKFTDNIELLVFDGHTKAMQLPLITTNTQKHFFTGDLIARVHHLRLAYVMAFDLLPMTTIDEKQNLLKIAAKEHWKLIFQHDPHHIIANVISKNGWYTLDTQ